MLPPKEGFAPGAVGAVGMVVHRLVRAGAAATVVGAPMPGPPFADVPFLPAQPGWGWGRAARYAAGAVRVLRRLGPALVEVHNRPEVALRVANALPGTAVALFLHNDPRGMRGARTARQRRDLLGRVAGVVCVSAWLRDRFMEGVVLDGGGIDSAPAVLPNALDLDGLPPVVPREKLVLFAGRVVADKGVDAFVEACADLPPGWRAAVIGADRFRPDSPDTPFLRALRPRAAAAGVTLLGYLPHGEVLAALRRAAIAVVPSRWEEPFGLAALEAMACGAALVTTRRGALPEVAGPAALYADPDQPGALRAALSSLMTDDARREALSRDGLARAGRFGAPEAASRLLNLRADFLDRAAARRATRR